MKGLKVKYQTIIVMAVFFTIISQTPFLRVKLKIDTQLIMTPFWILSFFVAIGKKRRLNISLIKELILLFMIVIIGCFVLELNSRTSYFSSFTFSICISFLMLIIGNMAGDMLSDYWFSRMSWAYIFASIILAIDIYLEYFVGYNLLNINYVFRAKNSAGQILLTSVLLLLFQLDSRKTRWWKIGIIFAFLGEIVLMRSRATMFAAGLVMLYFMFSNLVERKYKNMIMLITSVILVICLFNFSRIISLAYNLVFNTSKVIKLSELSLDVVTSNRFSILSSVPEKMKGNVIWGLGREFYVDNVFVNAYGYYGIVIGMIVSMLVLLPLFMMFARNKVNKIQYSKKNLLLFRCISIVYVINGIFEGWAPFGPGAKCFFFWLVLGMFFSGYSLKENYNVESL